MCEPDNPSDLQSTDILAACVGMTVIQHANYLFRRKQAYEALHPQTRHGGPHHPLPANTKLDSHPPPPSFATAAGTLFGCTPRVIQRLIRIAREIPQDLQAALSSTPIANRHLDLYRISLMEPSEHRELLALLDASADPPPTLDMLTGRK
ncbi:MAG: hypothetical protein OXN81_16385 [Alphaproteobacteria bacterium]|nr:hypothetical protein [Alphaproteobacteria bacterium]